MRRCERRRLPLAAHWNRTLRLPPFGLPEPLELINEGSVISVEKFRDKSLGLWRIDQIPDL